MDLIFLCGQLERTGTTIDSNLVIEGNVSEVLIFDCFIRFSKHKELRCV